jgi:hypothetical protein
MRKSTLSGRTEAEPGMGATLYLGDDMVKSHMAEQIQYAGQAPPMFRYIRDRFEWTDQQCTAINWKGIGVAKKRLTRPQSHQTTQMMYGWLNVGHQKIKLEQDGLCPCCGKEEETQIHLYRCMNSTMRESLAIGTKEMEKTLYKSGMAAQVYLGFIDQICKTTLLVSSACSCLLTARILLTSNTSICRVCLNSCTASIPHSSSALFVTCCYIDFKQVTGLYVCPPSLR